MALATVIRDGFSAPFFDAAARDVLLLRASPTSGEWSAPDARVCAVTQADDLEWREAAGTGSLISWTIKPSRTRDGITAPDTVLGIIELDEGPWLSLWLPEADPAALRAGARAAVAFVHPDEGESLPIARLV